MELGEKSLAASDSVEKQGSDSGIQN